MKITNRRALPAPVVRAIEQDPYDGPGPFGREISVSQLISPPQIRSLLAKHDGELEADASDMLHALLGTSFHEVLRRGALPGDQVEVRLASTFAGWTVSGQPDRYVPGEKLLQDWKTCSAWKVMFPNPDWEAQLNIYAEILERSGRPVEKIEVVAFLKDLSEVRKNARKRCPETDILTVPLPLWPREKREAFILERIRLHESALQGEPTFCSKVDTWGGKRCERYCPVRRVCPQIAPDPLGFDDETETT